jgi:recombinational DNA repair protein RecR
MFVAQFDTCSAVAFSSAEIQVCVQCVSVTKNNACEIVEKTLRSFYVLEIVERSAVYIVGL